MNMKRGYDADRSEVAAPAEKLVNLAAVGILKGKGMFVGLVA